MFGEPCAELMDNNNNQSKVGKTAVGAEQMVLFCLCVFFLLPPRVKLDYFCLRQERLAPPGCSDRNPVLTHPAVKLVSF